MSLHVKCQVVGPGECARTKAAKGQRWCQLQVVIVAMSRGWSLFSRHFIDEGGSVTCWGHQAFHLAFIWQLSRINGVSTSMTLLWPATKSEHYVWSSDSSLTKRIHPVSIFKPAISDHRVINMVIHCVAIQLGELFLSYSYFECNWRKMFILGSQIRPEFSRVCKATCSWKVCPLYVFACVVLARLNVQT